MIDVSWSDVVPMLSFIAVVMLIGGIGIVVMLILDRDEE